MIATNWFLLRQFSKNDLENVYKGLSHPEVIKYYGVSYDSLEATKEQITWFSQLEIEGTGIWWAIEFLEDKEFCGAIGFNNLDNNHKRIEIGFWLLPEYWRRGIISEVLPIACRYAFEKLGLHRIVAQIETENVNSKKAIEKAGFVYEGTLRECEFKDGKYISLAIFSLLNKDFKSLNNS